jgi:nucleoside-triphosphatase THEP1
MRNPFFVEVRSDHGDIFANFQVGTEKVDSQGIVVKSFENLLSETIDREVKEITELPAGLLNY